MVTYFSDANVDELSHDAIVSVFLEKENEIGPIT